ncbi:hypothetical protein FGO68_gene1372 [Halteria grandinella]|uniref:CHAT domain-containing protein n=1 Tax=Halteria grandinella TaxID=5974 RepID=A0A8J8TAZ6_HALGN|nr:hypothetical protein FGO68_gene1372 [Halteria grandinella]
MEENFQLKQALLYNERDDPYFNISQRQLLNQTILGKSTSMLVEKKKLDIAFLYSDPLIYINKEKRREAYPQIIDAEGEFGRLRRFLEQKVKDRVLSIKREPANKDTLEEIIKQHPTILHIYCHGNVKQDPDTKKDLYYLELEDTGRRGMVKQYDEANLNHLLSFQKSLNQQSFIKLVFVSACHSEIIGQQFKRAGVPIVIAVNQHTQVADDVAREFSQQFYQMLLQGKSPNEAFKWAKGRVKHMDGIDLRYKFSCCCHHSHTKDCKWESHKKNKLMNNQQLACKIHHPICGCENKWIGKHKESCSFYQKFHEAIQSGKMIFPSSSSSHPQVTLCCCKEEITHDETQKFMFIERRFEDFNPAIMASEDLTEEEKARYILSEREKMFKIQLEADMRLLDDPIFEEKTEEFSQLQRPELIKVKDNIEQLTNLPCSNDPLKYFGRTLIVQEIVAHLHYDHKPNLIQIYGFSGSGKSAIAIHAAKYSFDRRNFPDGAYYIDFINKQYDYQFVETIAECLRLELHCSENIIGSPRNSLQELIVSVNKYKILLLLDNCRKFLSENKKYFNEALKILSENTPNMKIIVVTDNEDQIMHQSIWRKGIPELTKQEAMALFWHIVKDKENVHVDFKIKFRSLDSLCELFYFKESQNWCKSYNTQTIINIAMMIENGEKLSKIEECFSARLREKEQAGQIEEAHIDVNGIKRDEALLLTTKMKLIEVSALYDKEIDLLFLLCQYPAGLLYSDIEKLCNLAEFVPQKWKKFLGYISNEDKVKREYSGSQSNSKEATINQALAFVDVTYISELDEFHYQVNSNYVDYINGSFIANQQKQGQLLLIALKHLAQLSCRLVIDISKQRSEQLDISMVGSHINHGVWSLMQHISSDDAFAYGSKLDKPDLRQKYHQANFMNLINLKLLQRLFLKDNLAKNLQFIYEICINTNTILLMMERLHDVDLMLLKALEIAKNFKENYLLARLKLLEVYRSIKQGKQYSLIKKRIDKCEKIFLGLDMLDGVAEVKILDALALIQSIEQRQYEHLPKKQLNIGHQSYQTRTMSRLASSIKQDSPNVFLDKEPSMNYISKLNNDMSRVQGLFGQALDHFDQLNKETGAFQYGKAKACYLLAKFCIEKQLDFQLEIDRNALFDILQPCISLYNQLGIKNMEAKSLLLISQHYLDCQELKNAKENIEKALKIFESANEIECTNKCTLLLNEILDKFRYESNNCFIFAKAFPIVEKVDDSNIKMVGTLTKYLSNFRQKVINGIKERNKVINVRFDQLNLEMLDYVKNNSCRVLHISSDVYRKDSLCIEGENGLVEYINLEDLRNILQPQSKVLQVDVVVLAIPDSEEIAKVFIELGVPYVVAFEFNENADENLYMMNVKTIPLVYNAIYEFCQQFYLSIIEEKTIKEAFDSAANAQNSLWKEENRKRNCNLDDWQKEQSKYDTEEPDHCAILLSAKDFDNIQRFKLYDKTSLVKPRLNEGEPIDSSRQRGRTNLGKYRSMYPMTGRQVEQYRLMVQLKNPNIKILNLHGMSGIGKTRFLVESAYFLHSRSEFQDGVFIVEMKDVRTIEQLKIKLKIEETIIKEDIISEFQNKKTLFIFDNINNILKNNRAQFDSYLQTLLRNCTNLKVILTSKQRIKRGELLEDIFKYNIQLGLLDRIEAADLILSTVLQTRNLSCKELGISEEFQIHQQLQQSIVVDQCQGIPKYLIILAEKLKTNLLYDEQVFKCIQIPKDQIIKARQLKIKQDQGNEKDQNCNKSKKEKKADKMNNNYDTGQLKRQSSIRTNKSKAIESLKRINDSQEGIPDQFALLQNSQNKSFISNKRENKHKSFICETIDEITDEYIHESQFQLNSRKNKKKKSEQKMKLNVDKQIQEMGQYLSFDSKLGPNGPHQNQLKAQLLKNGAGENIQLVRESNENYQNEGTQQYETNRKISCQDSDMSQAANKSLGQILHNQKRNNYTQVQQIRQEQDLIDQRSQQEHSPIKKIYRYKLSKVKEMQLASEQSIASNKLEGSFVLEEEKGNLSKSFSKPSSSINLQKAESVPQLNNSYSKLPTLKAQQKSAKIIKFEERQWIYTHFKKQKESSSSVSNDSDENPE